MQSVLVVDSNRQVVLTNQDVRKCFDAPEISLATHRLENFRDPKLDRSVTGVPWRRPGSLRVDSGRIANRAP